VLKDSEGEDLRAFFLIREKVPRAESTFGVQALFFKKTAPESQAEK